MDQLERLGGADSYTRLLSIGSALPAPVGCVDAQVAFGGFALKRIPDRPMRPLRAGLDARLAANAFVLINDPDIAMRSVHVSSLDRTILDAERRNALPADGHINVERILRE